MLSLAKFRQDAKKPFLVLKSNIPLRLAFIFLFLTLVSIHAEIQYERCESWANRHPILQTILPYAEEGTVYPLKQNKEYLLVAGLQVNAEASRVKSWIERDFKKQKISFQAVTSKKSRPNQFQWLARYQGQVTLVTLSSLQNFDSQIQLFCSINDPAFAADFPSLLTQCPGLDSLPAATLLHLERFDSNQSNVTQLLEFPESIEQTLPRINAHFVTAGWTPIANPVKGENGSVLMLFIEARNSILITLLERNGKTMMLSNAHPRQPIPHFKMIP